MSKNSKIENSVPMRTCIGTGVKKPKSEMIRLVLTTDGNVVVDVTGRVNGRGANIDMNLVAFDAAVRKKAIQRALKLERVMDAEEIRLLRDQFEQAIDEKKFRKGNKPVVLRVKKSDLPA